jgi:hypothetical protein
MVIYPAMDIPATSGIRKIQNIENEKPARPPMNDVADPSAVNGVSK